MQSVHLKCDMAREALNQILDFDLSAKYSLTRTLHCTNRIRGTVFAVIFLYVFIAARENLATIFCKYPLGAALIPFSIL